MKFVRVDTIIEGVGPLRERIAHDLANAKQVLWLVPGGSNIPLTVAVMAQLPEELTRSLNVMLTDERFGPVGHADSNTQQLGLAGFLPKLAKVIPVLRPDLSLEETCKHYGEDFTKAVHRADVVIGQFGMGADGHLAGILPGSEAVASGDMTTAYVAPQFTRLTLTPKALQHLTVAICSLSAPRSEPPFKICSPKPSAWMSNRPNLSGKSRKRTYIMTRSTVKN